MLSLIAYYSSHTTLPTFQEAEFHHYCRPWLNPVLSDFCKKLTGIRQVSTILFYYVVHAIMLHHCLDPYLLYIYIAITITHSQSMGTGCLCTSLIPGVWYTLLYWLRGEMQEDSMLCFEWPVLLCCYAGPSEQGTLFLRGVLDVHRVAWVQGA